MAAKSIRDEIPDNTFYQVKGTSWLSHIPFVNMDKPIHENMTLAALMGSKFSLPRDTTYDNMNSEVWEIVRGAIWNDDPACLLFNDEKDNNHSLGKGVQWYYQYKAGSKSHIIQRSHYGDLQFLHAMGASQGESAETTKRNIMNWLEIMYKLATGNQGVTEHDHLENVNLWLRNLFNKNTTPSGHATLGTLLLATTPSYKGARIDYRAIGSCFHVLQDSYARGHCSRAPQNPQQGPFTDKGKPERFGAILNFHTYKGQNESNHSHYDGMEGEAKPNNLESFNDLHGARDAIDACTKLANFWQDKASWEDVRKWLEDEVFVLDKDVTPSDTNV